MHIEHHDRYNYGECHKNDREQQVLSEQRYLTSVDSVTHYRDSCLVGRLKESFACTALTTNDVGGIISANSRKNTVSDTRIDTASCTCNPFVRRENGKKREMFIDQRCNLCNNFLLRVISVCECLWAAFISVVSIRAFSFVILTRPSLRRNFASRGPSIIEPPEKRN